MEQHVIALNQGIHLTPSAAEDGQLADCINLIPRDGSLRNAPSLSDTGTELAEGHTLVCIHNGRYITRKGTSLYYHQDSILQTSILTLDDGENITNMETMGNTIIVLTEKGMRYLLWQGSSKGYKHLGSHLPELPISFGLQGKVKHSSTFTLPTTDVEENITEAIQAQVNKFIAENQTESGRFILPFFVRYAYRLYDGTTLTMHSAPVLMAASAGIAPAVLCTKSAEDNFGKCEVVAIRSYLDYKVESSVQLNALKEWEDIVASVDVFISAPIYTYDQNEKCVRKTISINGLNSDSYKTFSVYKQNDQDTIAFPEATYPIRYQHKTLMQSLIMEKGSVDIVHDGNNFDYFIPLPAKSDDKVKEEFRNCSNFYLLRSFRPDELNADERTIIEIEDDYLQSLVNRERMTDDYDSHDSLIPQYPFSYNHRLNLANIRKELFDGFHSKALIQHTDGQVTYYTDGTSPTIKDIKSPMQVFVHIKQDGKEIVVANEDVNNAIAYYSKPLFLFYPNPNAYKAVVRLNNGYSNESYEFPLEKHNYLHGSFYFAGWNDNLKAVSTPTTTADKIVSMPNKLYTSEINNPFFFPVGGINTIGTGEIVGISAATKALSQGQFGQFPLYVFATDGIWAMEVSADGKYIAKQPITRDVCNNPRSITQLDNAVVYATARGLNLISGSETRLLSASLEGASIDIPAIPSSPYPDAEISDEERTFVTLAEQLKDASVSYDSINRIVHIYPSDKAATHYTLHLDSGEWTRCSDATPDAYIDGYPNATLQIGRKLMTYALPTFNADNVKQGYLLTREIALGSPLYYKCLYDLRTLRRLYGGTSSAKVVVLASNDRTSWCRVTSLKAKSWKWYRFAIYTNLSDADVLCGIALMAETRRTNKLR